MCRDNGFQDNGFSFDESLLVLVMVTSPGVGGQDPDWLFCSRVTRCGSPCVQDS